MFSKFLDPKNDVAFKKIFGTEKNKDILIHFINDILSLTAEKKVHSIEFLSTIQDPEIASKKQSIVDVLCKDGLGVQYIVEMQVAKTKGFEKRAQLYAAKAYSRQQNAGDLYHPLKEVIFIAITDYTLFPDKTDYKSNHLILDEKTKEHDLKDFRFCFIELAKFNKKKEDSLNNMLEKWCYFFKYADETREEDLKRIIGSDLVIARAYEALNQYNWTEAELNTYEREKKRVLDEQAVLEQKLDDAEARGIEKGKAEGKAEGKMEVAKAMLAKNKPLDEISAFTGLTLQEIEKLK
jgi:predicted transposase/invertase (TIGR01784 family)